MKNNNQMIAIGSKVNLPENDWGIVIYFDGDDYHVAMFGNKNDARVYSEDEVIQSTIKTGVMK